MREFKKMINFKESSFFEKNNYHIFFITAVF